MDNVILETERLWMRKFMIEDAEDMYLLNANPDVILYTGDVAFDTVEAPFLHSQYSPRKLVNTDSGPFIMLGLAIATLVVLKIMS